MKIKRSVIILLTLLCAGGAFAVTAGEVVISPESKGVLINRVFKDYKSSGNPNPGNADLDHLFIDDGLNGIRTPIYGNLSKPAHPADGVVDGSYYTGHVNTILRAKQRNPDLMVFASKKLEGQNSFPAWTKDASGVLAAPYARMLADYIEYMAAQGITIDVLGIDNERRYNEGSIMPQLHRDVVDALRALSVTRGFSMPLIIGHEDFNPNRNNWMSSLMNSGWGDRLDLFGTHYYPRSRPLTALQSDLAWAGSREKWHTELHWDTRDPDDMLEAEQAVSCMWDCTDNGMNGLMWWGYSRTGFRGSLMRQFTVPLVNAYALAVDDPDGANISANGRLQTRAFLQGNQLTVYAVNVGSGIDWSNLVFRVDSGYIVSPVSALQWTGTNQTSGAASSVTPLDSQSFAFHIPDRSLSSFTFTYAPSSLFARYAFDGNAADSSANGFQGLEVGSVSYPPGREGQALSGQVEIPSVYFGDFLAVFWLKTSAISGPLITGTDLAVAVANSRAVFTLGTNTITAYKPVNDGRWHQIAVERTAAGGEMRLYVDGRLEAYAVGASDPLAGTNLTVGGISGLIDELKIYDRPFSTADRERYGAPSVLLTAGGDAEERGPVASHVALSSVPAGADYPYIDLVEDDGTWLQGYSGSTLRNMSVGTAAHAVLLPNLGKTFFTRTTDAWWRGVCKPQFDDLTLEAGTYTLSFYVGDADTNYLFYSVHTDPVAANHIGLTATDPLSPVLPDMNATVNSLIHRLDTNITTAFEVAAVPGDGQWVQWRITYEVPANSPLLGRQLGFLFRKPARNSTYETRSTGAFDGPLVLDFAPALPAVEPPLQVAYSLLGSTADSGVDCQTLPVLLTEGTNAIVPVADLIEEGAEQLLFSLSASSNYYLSGSATAAVSIVDHPMDGWRAAQFGTNATNPLIAGDAANPDGDRYSNEEEWLLDADPLNAADTLAQISVSDPDFILTYSRRDPAVSGIEVHAAWTPALTSNVWKVHGDGLTEITIGQNQDVQTQAVLVPLDSTQKFIRIEVVK